MVKRFFIRVSFWFVLFIFWNLPVLAQEVGTAWARTYNGPANKSDLASALTVDASGNIYVTGHTDWVPARMGQKYTTIKYYPNGDTAWVRRYSGPGNDDEAFAIAVDGSGNVYVTGSSSHDSIYPAHDCDFATIRYDAAGKQLWVRRYDGSADDWSIDVPHAIALDRAGSVYVTGESDDIETSLDYTTIKYDSTGNQLWIRRYDGIGCQSLDVAYALGLDASGNVYVTGKSHGPKGDSAKIDYESIEGELWLSMPDYVTIKYDYLGNELWVRRYDGPGNAWDEAYAIAVDASGNVYVTGLSFGSAEANYNCDYATIKYDSSGSQLWVCRYNGPENSDDIASAIAVDAFGNVYVTGRSIGVGGATYDYATIKYDSKGNQLWVKRYDGPKKYSSDQAEAIALDGFGNVYVTGTSGTIRYDTDGNQLQVWTSHCGKATAVDVYGNAYVTGTIVQKGSKYPYIYSDYFTIKYIRTEHIKGNQRR